MRLISKYLLLSLLLGSFFGTSLHASTQQEEDSQAYKAFALKGKKSGKGSLLTAPKGVLPSEVTNARLYITNMIQDLVGEDLKSREMHFIVNIYTSPTPNAWVQKYKSSTGQELDWNKNHQRPWPLRAAWGWSEDKKPIVEFGITTGLLRALEYEDELAFIMAHEAAHVLEGHIDHKDQIDEDEIIKDWINSQAHEVVADHLAIERMVGKYDINQALLVMERLHPREKPSTSNRYEQLFEGVAGTHHAEGVRFSALQANIEFLRKTKSAATNRTPRKSPSFLKLRAFERKLPDSYQGKPQSREKYFKILDNLLKGKTLPKAISLSPGDPEIEFIDLLGTPKEQSYARLLLETVDIINKAPTSKKAKMNALIQAMALLGPLVAPMLNPFNSFPENALDALNSSELNFILKFLVENTVGDGAWTMTDYMDLMSKIPFESRFGVEMPLLGTSQGRKLLNHLNQFSSTWVDIFNHWTSLESFLNKAGEYEVDFFAKILFYLTAHEVQENKIKEVYRDRLVKAFEATNDPQKFLAKTSKEGLSEFSRIYWYFGKSREEKCREPWVSRINKVIARYTPEYQKRIFSQIISMLKNPLGLMKSFELGLGFGALQNIDLLPGHELEELLRTYEQFIQKYFFKDSQGKMSWESFNLEPSQVWLHAELLKRNITDRDYVIKNLRFMLSVNGLNFPRVRSGSAQSMAYIEQLLRGLSKSEIFSLIEGLSPTELAFRAEVDQLKKKYGVTSIKSISRSRVDRLSDEALTRQTDRLLETYAVAQMSIDRQANFLELVSSTNRLEDIFDQFDTRDFLRMLKSMKESKAYYKFLGLDNFISFKAFDALLNLYIKKMPGGLGFARIVSALESIFDFGGVSVIPSLEQEQKIRALFLGYLEKMPLSEQYKWLTKKPVRKIMGSDFVGKTLANYVYQKSNGDRMIVKAEIGDILKEFGLPLSSPEVFSVFKNEIAVKVLAQPQELDYFFALDEQSKTKQSESKAYDIRGLSGFSSFTRQLPFAEQIEMIEFIMGRTLETPKALVQLQEKRADQGELNTMFLRLRADFLVRSEFERGFVVNTILAGPSGIVADSKGLELLHSHLLRTTSGKAKGLAEILLNALKHSEGRTYTLILSYALAQKNEGSTSTAGITQVQLLRSLLDFFGAPGVKLAQYLAFTSEFSELQSALEKYQDAAMPISHFQALELLNKRFGKDWPTKYRVLGIKGTGSVNVAIEYQNISTGKNEIVSVLRDEIETRTQEDFRRFKLLIAELTKTPELKKRFGFLIGLMDIVERSVSLEFNKSNAFAVQKMAHGFYNHKVGDWTIKSVDAYSVSDSAIFMEKASGVSASKLLKTDPKAYESAMRSFMQVEYGLLRGVGSGKNWVPIGTFANPDIHDGQLMIDVSTKTVRVLDFGQAIAITNLQREFALDLLLIISGALSPVRAATIISNHAKNFGTDKVLLSLGDLEDVFARKDRMDKFVHLLATISNAGFEVPLATVHWVLGANRLIKLGEKVRLPAESSIKWMLGMRRVGLPLSAYNAGKSICEKLVQ